MALEAAGSIPVTHPIFFLPQTVGFRGRRLGAPWEAIFATPPSPLVHQGDTSAEPGGKIVSRERLLEIRRCLRQRGQRVIFTNGCFDLLHRGHVEYLRQARGLGDTLIVGLNNDASAGALKGPGHPIQSQEDRAALLAEMQCVSLICIFEEPSVEPLVRLLLPDVLVKGGDYSLEDVVGREVVEAAGGLVATLALWEGASTSELIRQIKSAPE